MIIDKFFNILKDNQEFIKFIKGKTKIEVYYKDLKKNEIMRLNQEYPNLFNNMTIKQIFYITLIKSDHSFRNIQKINKIKFYFDKEQGKIIRILKK